MSARGRIEKRKTKEEEKRRMHSLHVRRVAYLIGTSRKRGGEVGGGGGVARRSDKVVWKKEGSGRTKDSSERGKRGSWGIWLHSTTSKNVPLYPNNRGRSSERGKRDSRSRGEGTRVLSLKEKGDNQPIRGRPLRGKSDSEGKGLDGSKKETGHRRTIGGPTIIKHSVNDAQGRKKKGKEGSGRERQGRRARFRPQLY